MKKYVLLLPFVLLLALWSRANEKYRVKTKTDSNGYAYEMVVNDPMNVRIYTLANGLKVYLKVNRNEPRIETYIPVKAGSVYDPKETTGLAHYLEHMMFKGTSKIGTTNWEEESKLINKISDLYEKHKATDNPEEKKEIYKEIDKISQEAAKYAIPNEYINLVKSIGAKRTNAYTTNESTVYMNNIPSNELEKWLKIESERFSKLVLRLFHTEIESVYEEFNMKQDNDYRKVWGELFENLFPNHSYGPRVVIGKAEHLKNPSMVNLHNYFDTYYVPNNMAICLSGDLDFEKTIQLIDKYWGKFKPSDKSVKMELVSEKEITKPIVTEVLGPTDENICIGFRFKGAGSEDEDMVQLVNLILSNGEAGLFDLNLMKNQKVLEVSSGFNFQKYDGTHYLKGKPKAGQTLEEVKDLILGELDKVKKGEFDKWLLRAVVNRFKVKNLYSSESNRVARGFAEAFVLDRDWSHVVSQVDRLERVTKQQVVDFVNKHYKNNYVVVYKRKGTDKNIVKVDKPTITPIKINRKSKSEFMTNLLAEKTDRLEPVYVDFEKSMITEKFKDGIEFNYIKNNSNEAFECLYVIDIGKEHNKELALAVNYLKYIGTTKYSSSELSQEFFKHGLSYKVITRQGRSFVLVSGLRKSLDRGIELVEHLLKNAKADKDAYKKYVDNILQKRKNQRSRRSTIHWDGMLNYGKYGKINPMTDILSEEKLRAIDPEKLVAKVASLTSYPHKILYYGQDSPRKVKSVLNKYHITPDILTEIPQKTEYKMLPTDKSRVFFVDYNMVQAHIIMFSKQKKFDKDMTPVARLFNEYYGGGIGSVVFQEIRESKGLAYAASAEYLQGKKINESDYVLGFVATQADKLGNATEVMSDLLKNMRRSDKEFNAAKDAVLKRIETSRVIKSNIFWEKLNYLDKGINTNFSKEIYEKISDITIDDIQKFFDENIKDNKYSYLVIADKKLIDMNKLKQLGEVTELSLKDIFNY